MTIAPLETTVEDRLDAIADQLARLTGHAEEQQARMARWESLVDDALCSLGAPVLEELTQRLAILEGRGYFGFARAAAGVADEVVTHFSEDDVRRLGENVVMILEVVKELTQPEIMSTVRRMVEAVERQHEVMAAEPAEPPSLFGLVRRLRDPEVRRGLGRALDTLQAVTEADVPAGGRSDETTDETPGGA